MPGEVVAPLSAALTQTLWQPILTYFWNAVFAVIILILGFIIGKVIGAVVEEILLKVKVDKYLAVKRAEFRISHIFSVILRWILYLVFIQQAAAVLAITVISDFVAQIVYFLPQVVMAIIVVAVGYALARYVEHLVVESEAVYAGLMGKVFFFFIIYIAIAIALPLVGLNPTLVNNILLIIVGSIGLGIAIALGLGLKDTISEISKPLGAKFARHVKKSGK